MGDFTLDPDPQVLVNLHRTSPLTFVQAVPETLDCACSPDLELEVLDTDA